MALTSTNRRSSARTAARNRRVMHRARLAAASGRPFRARLWLVLAWWMAEGMATPPEEQDEFLTDLETRVEEINERRRR